MKKTFPFKVPGKDDARVIEAIKNDVRKYAKRERRKQLPEGFDLWDFNCRVGPDEASAAPSTVKDVITAIDALAQIGSEKVYVEVLAFAAKRDPRPGTAPVAAATAEPEAPEDSESKG